MDYYSDMLPTLSERASSGALSSFGFSNTILRSYLKSQFNNPFGEEGCFIGDPAFEAVFGWEFGSKKIKELSGELIQDELVEALNNGDLKKEFYPYSHQERSWNILNQEKPQSVIISSGTGSGKTECFMVPILNRLLKERSHTHRSLVGVRAIFLYPLNALINSQRERLRIWTEPFGEDIRFCLYNGLTKEKVKASERAKHPNEVLDRETLRLSPPPILVTNPTMLEFMLVRAKDNPIIEQSKGKLETIVLDEAHTYIGSQAAEMTLLLRRVLQAFGKKPDEVRFVATSATIGEDKDKAKEQLNNFLSQIAGVEKSKVHVVEGSRIIPSLKNLETENTPLNHLKSIENPDELYKALEKHPIARKIRALFTGNRSAAKLSSVCHTLYGKSKPYTLNQQKSALEWLDLLTTAQSKKGDSYLPLRAHIFHKTLAGLWACADPKCELKHGTILDQPEWPFGMVYLDDREECGCGAPVYEIVSCTECGEVYLDIEIDNTETIMQPSKEKSLDEFELEVEDDSETIYSEEIDHDTSRYNNKAIITNRDLEKTEQVSVIKTTRKIVDNTDEDTISLIIREYHGEEHGIPCPKCLDGSFKKHNRFRSHTIGAPFLLNVSLPTLLNYATEKKESSDLPFNGRRLLTFNDSRQGSARIAAKLQQDAELSKARGLIYHYVLEKGGRKNEYEITQLEDEIHTLESINNKALADLIKKKRKELEKKKKFSAIPYHELKKSISNERGDFELIWKNYRKYDSILFSNSVVQSLVAELLIFREFARRPRRQNNLETLGLIGLDYPSIDAVSTMPTTWQGEGYTLEEWKTFLKICIDFFVRAGGSLESSNRELHNWLGLPFYRTYLVSPKEEDLNRLQRRWPNVKRGKLRSRIVRLLIYLIRVDPDSARGQDIIDELLQIAWDDLLKTGTLEKRENGYILPLNKIAFSIPSKTWICPITRRFLDKTIRNITPYLPLTFNDVVECEEVKIPRYDKPFGDTQNPFKNRQIAQEWIIKQESIKALRDRGLWSIFNDRVIEMMPYYSSAEHSAQQDSSVLELYERLFKEGRINILSCSTTMEMGIDIGGIRMVAMNNVPPHPANYLQRSGRAGRRKESRSTTFTLCKPNPHDLAAFENSTWAFDTKLPAPTVSLNSKIIVQRHINAFLLSHFLNQIIGLKEVDKYKLSSGWFFTDDEKTFKKFIDWTEELEVKHNDELLSDIRVLTRGSIYDGTDPLYLIKNSGEHIFEIADKWRNEYQAIDLQRKELLETGGEIQPAIRAIDHQLKRLIDEYLLRELAAKGFLPGYGFPSNITVFDYYNVAAYKQEKQNNKDTTRDDNTFQNRELPSRDIISALGEYAPGADVVLDGVVYKSEGITLNWHIPNTVEEVKESQAIKYAWRCHNCGASGSTFNKRSDIVCDQCSSPIKSYNIEEYIEPSGFSVDFYERRHNDVTTQHYIPVEKPWVQAFGQWVSLLNPELGRYRTTTDGHIFHYSKGINGTGYAICMSCGRTEPMDPQGNLPKIFQKNHPHNKLRGKKGDRICPGSENGWAIKKNVALGHQLTTDILEIQLKDVHGQWLRDKDTAATLAVVFRDSLADLLGVQAVELICDIKESKVENQQIVQSILIYDHNASGFSSNVDHIINEIFNKARKQLDCPKNCESNCPHCVLDFDQRFRSNALNRYKGLAFLNQEWFRKFRLPSDLDYFHGTSQIEQKELYQALIREVNNTPNGEVYLFAKGKANRSDIAISTLRSLSSLLSHKLIHVNVVFPKALLKNLEEEDRFSLLGMLDRDTLNVMSVTDSPVVNNALIIAAIKTKNETIVWATRDERALEPNEQWGISEMDKYPIIKGSLSKFILDASAIKKDELQNKIKGKSDVEIQIHHEMNGPLIEFGDRFWEKIIGEHNGAKKMLLSANSKLSEIKYNDRYLHNPLSAALLLSLFKGLKKVVGKSRWDGTSISINTTHKNQDSTRYGNMIYNDWVDPKDRDLVLHETFRKEELKLNLNIEPKYQLHHGRVFEITFEDNSVLSVRLDQGVGYWRVEKPRYSNNLNGAFFDFSHSNTQDEIEREAEQIVNANPKIIGQNTPTEIFVKYRN